MKVEIEKGKFAYFERTFNRNIKMASINILDNESLKNFISQC